MLQNKRVFWECTFIKIFRDKKENRYLLLIDFQLILQLFFFLFLRHIQVFIPIIEMVVEFPCLEIISTKD